MLDVLNVFGEFWSIQENIQNSEVVWRINDLEKCRTALETKWEMLEIVEIPKMSLQMSKSSITYANNFRDFDNF